MYIFSKNAKRGKFRLWMNQWAVGKRCSWAHWPGSALLQIISQWTWTSPFTSLKLSFFICKMEHWVIQGWGRNAYEPMHLFKAFTFLRVDFLLIPRLLWAGCVHAKLLQSCLTLCDRMDCNPPGSSIHGILQARILQWATMPSSRGSSWARDQTQVSYVSCISRQILYLWATKEA